jgi:hypothetical protein
MNSDNHARRSLWKSPASVTAVILLLLLLANHFVDGWNWPPKAFVLFGILIFGIGLTYELVTRNVDTLAYRSAVGLALVSGFVLFWGNFVQAADDVNPAAMMYLVVPVLGIIGAVIARFRSNGMARTMFATALAQVLVLVIALMRNLPMTAWTAPVWRGFGGNALFAMLFFGSALLFRTAARGDSGPSTV